MKALKNNTLKHLKRYLSTLESVEGRHAVRVIDKALSEEPSLFKKGDLVYSVVLDPRVKLVVVTDQRPEHVSIQVRYQHDRDNRLGDKFIKPKYLRYARTF